MELQIFQTIKEQELILTAMPCLSTKIQNYVITINSSTLLEEWNSKIHIIKPFNMHRILVSTGKSLLNSEEYTVASNTVIK